MHLIFRLPGYYAPDASGRVGDVAEIAWNQVDVDMADGLAGGIAHIDTMRRRRLP